MDIETDRTHETDRWATAAEHNSDDLADQVADSLRAVPLRADRSMMFVMPSARAIAEAIIRHTVAGARS